MGAVWSRCRGELRARWRGSLAVALLVALASGAVLTAIAGARRTASVAPRYLDGTLHDDGFIELGASDPHLFDRLEGQPDVELIARLGFAVMFPPNVGDRFFPFLVPLDGRYGREVDRFPVVDGRRPRPDAPNEILLTETTAAALDLGVGEALPVISFSPEQATEEGLQGPEIQPEGPSIDLRVVGIARTNLDIANRDQDITISVLSPAFEERYRDEIYIDVSFGVVKLRDEPGALRRFTRVARDLAGDTTVSVDPAATAVEATLEDSTGVLATGLALFAAAAGAAALVALAVVLGRQALLAASDDATLAALGMSRRQRFVTTLSVAAPAILIGTVLGAVVALSASPLMPIGLARRAEIERGVDVDVAVLALGGLATLVLVGGIAALAAWRETRRATSLRRAPSPGVASSIGRAVAAAGPVSSTGVRMAFEPGRGPTAVPVRPALAGAAVGIAAVLGVLGFGAALDRLAAEPARYGWAFDAGVTHPNLDEGLSRADLQAVRTHPDVEAVALARFDIPVTVGGRSVRGLGFRNVVGDITPTVIEGQAPRGPEEVALGTDTLDALGRDVGDTVRVEAPGRSARYRIVGRGVFPSPDDALPLADGAAFAWAGLDRIGLADGSDEQISGAAHVLRLEDGADFDVILATLDGDYQVGRPVPPPEVENLSQVDRLPQVLAVFLAAIALLAVGYSLVTSVHRRRRDLAMLGALGFVRRQVLGVVAWQASTTALIGVVIGIPAGLVIGRVSWAIVADDLGVATDPAVPVVALLLAAPLALAVANLIALVPGRIAARRQPAVVLRSE